MKRKNSIARKKAKKKKLLFKDPKILNFYTKFKSIVFKDIKRRDFALAVSGGADSLCLAYFAKIYSIQSNSRAFILCFSSFCANGPADCYVACIGNGIWKTRREL